MKLRFLVNKTGKWIFGIFLFLLFIFLFLFFLLEPIVKKKLTEQVFIQTGGAYSLSIQDLKINIFYGNATAQSIAFKPDTTKILKDKSHKDLYEVIAPEISISGMNLWQLLFNNQLSVDKLDIIKPQVKWVRNFDQDIESNLEREINERNSVLPPVKINIINLNESSLIITKKGQNSSIVSFEKASLRIENFLLKADSTKNMEQKINFDDFTFFIKDYSMKLPDSLNTVHFDSLKASVKHSTVILNGLEIMPRYGKKEFSRRKGVESDRIELYNKEVYFKGLDFKALKEDEKLIASFLVIDSVNMMVFRDKTHPVKPTERVLLIQEQIRKAPIYIRIDSLELNNTQITYQEKVEEDTEPGNINFVNFNASISNITNDSVLLENGTTMKAYAYAYLMGVGKISAYFSFPLGHKNNYHTFQGTVSPMELDVINPMLKYVAFVEIRSGKLNSLDFQAQLNEDSSDGSMVFTYDKFKVQVLNKDEEKGGKGFISFLANNFVIKSNNPSNGKLREGEMSFSRDKNKSMINFWWKTLLSGLKDSLGVPTKEEK